MKRVARISSFVIALLLSALAHAQVAPVARAPVIPPATPILAHNGLVVAQESRAARIGIEILDRGGNAVDAAVAVGFALARNNAIVMADIPLAVVPAKAGTHSHRCWR